MEPPVPLAPLCGRRLFCQLMGETAVAVEPSCVEPAGGDRRPHGAAGLELVRAVGEAAAGCEFDDLGKGLVHAFVRIPEAELAHAGRVEHECAIRQEEQLPMSGGMAATGVVE